MIRKRAPRPETDELQELRALHGALDAVQAMIWFEPDGTILKANENFCSVMLVTEQQIIGKHHSIFVEAKERETSSYKSFWNRLSAGETFKGEFVRVTGDGTRVSLTAFYNPIRNADGKVVKVLKFASDVTAKQEAFADLKTCLERVSQGDLTCRLTPSTYQEFEPLRLQFNQTLDRLESMVTSIDTVAISLADEAENIARNAKDLANRGESQATKLEETSAALEELSSAVNGTASNARQASLAAQTASSTAEQGTQVVSEAIKAMQEIQNGSGEISKIIEVIDSISFQTNLLALNAGIEAARAGDAGRGFAVVASEIRALAQRTAEAAKDISDLIVTSNTNVAEGAELVDQTGAALDRIGGEVARVVTNIDEISNATTEQAEGIGAVTQATSEMDIATQQNATLADKSARTAATLTESTAKLMQLVSGFQSRKGDDVYRLDESEIAFRRSA